MIMDADGIIRMNKTEAMKLAAVMDVELPLDNTLNKSYITVGGQEYAFGKADAKYYITRDDIGMIYCSSLKVLYHFQHLIS